MESERAVGPALDGGIEEDVQELTDYCARPLCRREYRRPEGRGRRQAFCSEVCRRTAERELRQTKSRLAHFEGIVEQLRHDVAAFGRSSTDDPPADSNTVRREAERAVARASGVVGFLRDSEEPVARELRALLEAVAPFVEATT